MKDQRKCHICNAQAEWPLLKPERELPWVAPSQQALSWLSMGGALRNLAVSGQVETFFPLCPNISNIYRIKYQPLEYCLRLSFSRSNDFLLFPSTKINEENVLDYT